jgi:outer membrane protein assembly complex protein YaeT
MMGTGQVIATALIVSVFACSTVAAQRDSHPQRAELFHSRNGGTEVPLIDDIVFTGLRRIAPQTVKAHIASRVGEEFDHARIEGDVRTLARLGWFKTIRVETVDVLDTPEADRDRSHRVRLSFYLEEHPFLTKVEYSGSRLLSREQIDKLLAGKRLAPKLGEPEDPVILHQIAGAIGAELADLSHPDARVSIHQIELPNATARVRFEISDGPHRPVGRVIFEGHPEVSEKLLRRQMRRITPGVVFAGLRGLDSYTPAAFEEDRERLVAYYQNHGFPEARVGTAQISTSEERSLRWLPWPRQATTARLEVAIPVEAGPLYRIASVETSDALAQAVRTGGKREVVFPDVEPGQPYSARGVESLRRAWQLRVQPRSRQSDIAAFHDVEAIRTLDAARHTARVKLDLRPTPPYLVRRLEFLGNRRFPDRYFRSRILLKEGMPLDDRALEAGLARLGRTGYFKPIKKEDVRVKTDELTRTADVSIRVEELGEQRASLVGGRGQFGSTLGIAYTVFNLLDRNELLSSRIEGGPESLQLALGFAKEGFLGSRGSLALSVFNTLLRPRLAGSVKGPFFKQQSEGVDATWSYAVTTVDTLRLNYDLSHSRTQYSPSLPSGLTGLRIGDVRTDTSSHAAGFGWTHDTGNGRVVLADSVSGGWLGGSENLVRSKAEYSHIFHDSIFDHQNAWAFRTNFTGVGSYSGDMPFYARFFPSDEFVRGLRAGELGPDAVVSSLSSSGATKYSASPAGADLLGSANVEYRVPLAGGTEAAGFFDLGSGLLLPNWLGHARPAIVDATNGIVHGSTGVELRWTLPGIGVPVRVNYALSVLRLNRWLPMPDGSLFHAHDRFSAFGWGLGPLF